MNFIEFLKRLTFLLKVIGYGLAVYFAILGFSTSSGGADAFLSAAIIFIAIAAATKGITWLLEGFFENKTSAVEENKLIAEKKYSARGEQFYGILSILFFFAAAYAVYELINSYIAFGLNLGRFIGGIAAILFLAYCADYFYKKWNSRNW
jgi:hypothetical protein